jgi:hypothetical protein
VKSSALEGVLIWVCKEQRGGQNRVRVLNSPVCARKPVRAQRSVALAVASSGIASLLLDDGKTAHSLLKIPLQLDAHSVCHAAIESEHAHLLRHARLLVWDETPMAHSYCFFGHCETLRTEKICPLEGRWLYLLVIFENCFLWFNGGP